MTLYGWRDEALGLVHRHQAGEQGGVEAGLGEAGAHLGGVELRLKAQLFHPLVADGGVAALAAHVTVNPHHHHAYVLLVSQKVLAGDFSHILFRCMSCKRGSAQHNNGQCGQQILLHHFLRLP